ncbi:MAG TPA: hypothetical protein VHW23_20890 [Kofleriaceae bacterium]|jgi:hypothetical protein|nr:hypothetical protein [Kofleriaceae bacterium]
MNMLSINKLSWTLLVLAPAGLVACGSPDATTEEAAQDGVAQAAAQPATTNDPRLLSCFLEYQAFVPTWQVAPAASFVTTFGRVVDTGVWASDGAYQLSVEVNPGVVSSLKFEADIFDIAAGHVLSSVELPLPQVGGDWLFELDGTIPPVTRSGVTFPGIRAYCSIKNPS